MGKFFLVMLLVVSFGVYINHLIFVNAKDQMGEFHKSPASFMKERKKHEHHSQNRYLDQTKEKQTSYDHPGVEPEIMVNMQEGYDLNQHNHQQDSYDHAVRDVGGEASSTSDKTLRIAPQQFSSLAADKKSPAEKPKKSAEKTLPSQSTRKSTKETKSKKR